MKQLIQPNLNKSDKTTKLIKDYKQHQKLFQSYLSLHAEHKQILTTLIYDQEKTLLKNEDRTDSYHELIEHQKLLDEEHEKLIEQNNEYVNNITPFLSP